jgi:ubiquinone biosynthesis accessory factor UbiJ
MPATPAWLASAEALLNRCIDSSARAEVLAQRLEGTSLQIDVDGIIRIRLSAHRGRLALVTGDDSAADAVISGSLPALLQLLKAAASRGAGSPPAAQIRGDAEIADRYRELIALARPDPEEELSRWIGDLPARRVSQFASGALEWARRARRTAAMNIAEYLQEEGRDLVNKTELEEFLRGVDELRDTADRVGTRLGRLEARLNGAGPQGAGPQGAGPHGTGLKGTA